LEVRTAPRTDGRTRFFFPDLGGGGSGVEEMGAGERMCDPHGGENRRRDKVQRERKKERKKLEKKNIERILWVFCYFQQIY
jgi:hypothetical protein